MKTIDLGSIIVSYNFVIGVLIMLSSQRIATFAGNVNKAHRTQIVRLTDVATFSIGACWAVLSGSVYIAFHLLRIGV
jgi:hypothetical protein